MNALPDGFMTEENLKNWMAGTVAVTSGSNAVYNPSTEFMESEEEKLREAEGADTLDTLKYILDDFFKVRTYRKIGKKTSESK